MDKIKSYLKRLWNAIWDSTDVDEKAEVALKEAKARIIEMKKELADVKHAAKNTVAQAKDVVDAAKGKRRKGRKPYKRKTNNNNSKK